ncbi:MAG TPA: hypothetical protein VD968_19515, partial [Pyrinomonadaceae bacterium]|nr:hypothetical protein [Pyrinomonadaceae bacterium]
ARDWCEGRVAERWWWQAFFGGECYGLRAPAVWGRSPEHVPAALHHLATNGRLAPFARALSASDARALLEAVTRSFGLTTLDEGFHRDEEPPDAERDSAQESSSEEGRGAPSKPAAGVGATRRPPWAAVAPEAEAAGIGRGQQCLLGVGLTLFRAPALARSHGFANATLRWVKTSGAEAHKPEAVNETRGRGHVPTQSGPGGARAGDRPRSETASGVERARRQPERKAVVNNPVRFLEDSGPASSDGVPGARAFDEVTAAHAEPAKPDHELARASSRAAREEAEGKVSKSASTQESGAAKAELSAAVEAKAGRSEEARAGEGVAVESVSITPGRADEWAEADGSVEGRVLTEARVETELGGLFYLINVGLYLGLYADFTSPLGKGSLPLPLFDFVRLLGARLLCGRKPDDPVWRLLAALSGSREGEAPCVDSELPAAWRVPAEWLKPFPEAREWLWSCAAGRLRVRHAEGFVLLDAPVEDERAAVEALGRELAEYDGIVSFTLGRGEAGQPTGAGGLDWWLDCLTGYVRARLRRALGVASDVETALLLCEQRARVHVTASHLDIVFSLAEHPVEVRLAGLDRDPGWVPSAGRFIAFHYE